MDKSKKTKTLLLALLVGILLVAAILTFIALGVAHPVPWLLTIALVVIPLYSNWKEKQLFAVWKDEYSVGIESLDNDHRKLLNLINNLQTAVHYHTGDEFEKKALHEVIDYTKYHFDREEKMLEKAGYEDLEAHKQQHKDMIKKIDGFVQEYEKHGYAALEEVALFLKQWLVEHINGTDQEYSSLLKSKNMI